MKSKKKTKVSERLRAWDQSSFDLTDALELNPSSTGSRRSSLPAFGRSIPGLPVCWGL